MKRFMMCLASACAAAAFSAGNADAQTAPGRVPWREEFAAVGTTARVLIIGAHPDDEDNALIAWLSLGRHVETAYLSLTRGENGVNLPGREREALLGMVRTAELLAERKRDGAHQYFTRAYDFGRAKNDSVVYAAWPRDSLLEDIVTVLRAFRPHVVISLFAGDSTDRDGQHQVAGRLAREAFMLAGDTLRFPAARSSQLGAWSVGSLYQPVDSSTTGALRINVGELDRERGRSYAEIGSEIRTLQRSQPVLAAPRIGAVYRFLRRDSVHLGSAQRESGTSSLFGGADSGWTRFAGLPLTDSARVAFDSMVATIRTLTADPARNPADSVSVLLGRIVGLATRARSGLGCSEPAALNCSGGMGDFAMSLTTVRDRASRALLDAHGIVIDVTADRETVATGDSVGVTAVVYNGGRSPVLVKRVSVEGTGSIGFEAPDAVTIAPDSVDRRTGVIKMAAVSYPWWLRAGVVSGTWIYGLQLPHNGTVNEQLIAGEDRILSTSAVVSLRVGNTDVATRVGPVVARRETNLRGDERHPVAGVPRISVLLERGKEYAAAGVSFERLYRVWVGSSLSYADTVSVTMDLLPGLRTDSATRSIALPAFGGRTIFFRVRGRWPIGEFPISVSVAERTGRVVANRRPGVNVVGNSPVRVNRNAVTVTTGLISFEYPHIPTQRYPRTSTDSVQAVDLRLPSKFRVAIVRSTRDVELESRIVELGIQAYTIDASTLGIADLSFYTTILIAPRAYAEVEALLANAAAVRRFAERGGTVVVLAGGGELLEPGVLPYPVSFAAKPITVLDPRTPVHIPFPRPSALDWPNRITSSDFDDWIGTRARELPASVDARYRRVVEMNDDGDQPTDFAILSARVGKGVFIYTGLSFDEQLSGAHPGAARLLVNLLSAASRAP
jgi:LmbE family N-acetylglucosaminyl deacetylase